MTDLYAGSQDISDLRGLECLLNLDRLMLHFNQVRNLWPLAGLEHLSELYLEANPVSDISPLQGIESLRTLQISETTVDDFSSLEGLGLTSLVANQLSIPDLATLPAFPSLEELQLMDCGLTDFASISDTQFPRLEVLAISGNAVTNWSFLDSLSGLTGLWIRSTGITHTVLNLIPSTVTELDLSGNDLNASSMLWLKALSKLRSLWLENSSIEEVDWIYAKSMTSLVFLSLAGNKTTPNLNGLDTATSVQELNIQNVGNMTSLNTIPEAAAGRLRYLNASYNGALWDISRLQASTNLTILELVECDIISIDDLENLNDLEEVSLNNNQITDISALSDTPKIHGMNLSNNLISDISPLATNTGLGASGSNLGQGDTVLLASNDFNCDDASAKETISSLRSWGVTVDICL
ncbi:MAG: hypothetical protein MUC50_09060 [Myxococcota bacterium]|nr:hypothetical protein [Myxococcota bacterium]